MEMDMLPDQDRTIWQQLLELVADDADAVLLRGPSQEHTRAQVHDRALAWAAALQRLGIGTGEHVLVHAGNRVEHVELLLASNLLGAVYSPVHPDLKGPLLRHAAELLSPAAVVVDEDRRPLWEAAGLAPNAMRLLLDGPVGIPATPGSHVANELLQAVRLEDVSHLHVPDPDRPALTVMTSGTTGPSKAVLMSSRFALGIGASNVRSRGITNRDRLHSDFSFCHTNAQCFTLFPALVAGAAMSWSERFSVSQFWDTLDQLGATQFSLFTAPMLMLLDRAPSPTDRRHRATTCFSVGTPRGRGKEFEQRFGVRLVEAYGMSECGALTFRAADHGPIESAGQPVPEWEVQVVDERLRPVPPHSPGRIVGRPRRPGLLMSGYLRDDAATLRTFQDLWYHTGDNGYFDADGNLWFLGRTGDVIRRRGENVSAHDVEETVRSTGLVRDAAAVGVPAALGEDDLLLVVELAQQDAVSADALYGALASELPRYCLPQYIRTVIELPRNTTGRVRKDVLRQEGTAQAWTTPSGRR